MRGRGVCKALSVWAAGILGMPVCEIKLIFFMVKYGNIYLIILVSWAFCIYVLSRGIYLKFCSCRVGVYIFVSYKGNY